MIRKVPAAAVGVHVPKFFRAQVHSVFHTAANLQVAGLDHLLTLIVSGTMDLPQGIRLIEGQEDTIRQLATDMELVCRNGVIRSSEYPYTIDLRGAPAYDGSILCTDGTWTEGNEGAYRAARDFLAIRQAEKQAELRINCLEEVLSQPAGVKDPRWNRFAEHLTDLVHASRNFDKRLGELSVQSLAGLGGGLTPTGDDVLVGFLAGLWATAAVDAAQIEWKRQLGECLRIASKGTNDISRTYLVLAAGGQFSSSLKDLSISICTGAPEERVRAAVEIASQVGHTSGLDAVTGLLAGLGAWRFPTCP